MTRIIITGRNCDVPQRAFSGHPHLVSGDQPEGAARRNLALPGNEMASVPRPLKGVSSTADQTPEVMTPKAAGRPPDKPAADWSEVFVLFASGVAFLVGFGLMWSVR